MSRLVSLCTPTTQNRRHFLAQCRRYVEAQTYSNLEWVIADGSDSPPVGILEGCSVPIRYVPVALGQPVGPMRNHCVRASRGDLILHVDDDDWISPRRAEVQAAELLRGFKVVDILTYFVLYPGAQPYAEMTPNLPNHAGSGGTLAHWRECWLKTPFRAHPAEDRVFVRPYYQQMRSLQDPSLYVYVRHGKNTADFPRVGERDDTAEVKRLLGDDFAFYEGSGWGDPPSA